MDGTRQRAGGAAALALGPDLSARVRTGAWIVLAWGIPFVLADAIVRPEALSLVLAVETVQMVLLLGAVSWLRGAHPPAQVVRASVAVVVGVYALTAASAALRGDLASTCFVLVAASVATGGLFPWGARPQLVTVAAAAVVLAGNAIVAPPDDPHTAVYPALGILSALLGSVWVAFEGDRERRARQRAASLLADQTAVLELMARGVALPTVLDALCLGLEAQTPGMLCSVLRLDGTRLYDAAGPSLPAEYRQAVNGMTIGPEEGCCGSAAYWRRPVIVGDIATDPRWDAYRHLAVPQGLRACWSAPVLAGDGECLGTLAMYHREPRTPTALEASLLETAAHLAGLALARARDEAVLARSNAQLAEESQVSGALLRVAESFLSALDTPRVLRELCRLARALVGCEAVAATIRDLDAQTVPVTADTAYGPWPLDGLRLPDAVLANLLGRLEGRSLLRLDPADGDAATSQLWHLAGARRALVAPLRRGATEPTGILLLADRGTDAPFTALQERVASGVAQLGSLALENAHLVEQLRAATAAKSEFVSTISHELRTPISVIIGYIDMLDDPALPEPEREELTRRVRRTSHELFELIQATLDLSRLEAGRDRPQLEPVDVTQLFAELAADFAALTRNGDTRLRWEPGPSLVCPSDARKLRIIVKNLIVNALKFTPHGTVTVRHRVAPGRWELEVEDTGVGIPPEQLGLIFDRFRQGDGSDRRSYGGVGLGLYLVRRLATQLGGTVRVISTPGKGSTFTVALPLGGVPALGMPPAQTSPAGTGQARTAPTAATAGKTPAPPEPGSAGEAHSGGGAGLPAARNGPTVTRG